MNSGTLLDVALPRPLVSVALTAYKAERTLPQAINSVLAQRVDFPIEIIVSDDCSPDGVRAIANAYRQKHPDVVRLLERDRNVGIQRNYYETFAKCRGKYIAWLDGDDYWTDPDKLSRQLQALESDPSISLCGHYVRWVIRGGPVTRERYPELPPGRYGITDILRYNFIPAVSVVFRNGIQRNLPDWYFEIPPLADWPIHVLAALSGDVLMLDQSMADYTLNPDGVCWGKGERSWYEFDARFYERVESLVPAHRRLIRREKGRRYESLAYYLRRNGDFRGSRKAAIKAFLAPVGADSFLRRTKHLAASLAAQVIRPTKRSDSLSIDRASAAD